MQPIDCEWPLDLPSEEEIERWDELPKLAHSCLNDDFYVYSLSCLRRRNFFGRWMPEGATWLYGFAGEYPWATPFNTEPEEWHGRGGYRYDLPVSFTPSWSWLAVG
jgi:hypothetical protein